MEQIWESLLYIRILALINSDSPSLHLSICHLCNSADVHVFIELELIGSCICYLLIFVYIQGEWKTKEWYIVIFLCIWPLLFNSQTSIPRSYGNRLDFSLGPHLSPQSPRPAWGFPPSPGSSRNQYTWSVLATLSVGLLWVSWFRSLGRAAERKGIFSAGLESKEYGLKSGLKRFGQLFYNLKENSQREELLHNLSENRTRQRQRCPFEAQCLAISQASCTIKLPWTPINSLSLLLLPV